ncbi:MAG TPA: F0F1 ATP synthase subunit A [Bacteroidia bacterium]|jgi:F-type H+-transporting ATPase subunit a
MTNKINIFKHFLLITILAFTSLQGFAYEPVDKEHNSDQGPALPADPHHNEEHKATFDAGKTIIEHVADSYDWHLWGHTSIHLPIILKTDKGIELFSSGKFDHGHASYQGNYNYRILNGDIVVFDDVTESVDEAATAQLWDFSITKNAMAMFISMIIMLVMFISVARAYTKNKGKAPRGLQSFIEPLVIFIRDDVAKVSIGKRYESFLPFLLTVFFFIWINNLMGLIPFAPGGVNVTGNISIAMVLALFVLIITFVIANKHYWRHVFAMPGVPFGVLFILTPIEILGLFLRPFVLMIRLFANITAGHIIALAFFSLIFIFGEMNTGLGFGVSILSLVFTVFMGAMELLVAFLQAYVFTLLTAIYFGAAVDEGHEIHNHVDDHAGEKSHAH